MSLPPQPNISQVPICHHSGSQTPECAARIWPTGSPLSREYLCVKSTPKPGPRLNHKHRGASQGLGRAIAFHLAARGANVLATATTPEKLKDVSDLQEEINAVYKSSKTATAPKIMGVHGPLLEPKTTYTNVVDAVEKHFNGDANILVLNAAIQEVSLVSMPVWMNALQCLSKYMYQSNYLTLTTFQNAVPLGEIDEGHISRFLTANIEFNVSLVQALLPHFRPDSRILACSSSTARDSVGGYSMYVSTKAAVEGLTRVWAHELGRRPGMERTTVNALSIGVVKTPLLDWMYERNPEQMGGVLEVMAGRTLVGQRLGTPEDIADTAGFLCSEESRWVTGSVICASGGATMIL